MKKIFLAVFVAFATFLFAFPAPRVQADGFGITPPYVTNNALTQNSHYEQTIILVRSTPTQDLSAKVTVNVPGANDWITVDRGTQFAMPSGVQQMPIIVSVNVPSNAKLGRYKGNIQVVVSPLTTPTAGTVGITIGAQIDVDLQVIDKKAADFKVHRVTMSGAEVGHTFWWMHFPGKVTFTMDMENVGNIAGSPHKVTFEYREYLTQKVLETETNTNGLASIDSFQSKQVTAEMPTYLPVGSYKVFYQIYGRDDEDVIGQGILDLSVNPPGTLTAYVGYGFWGIRFSEKLITFGIILAILLALYAIFYFSKRFIGGRGRKKGHNRVFAPPPPPPPPRKY